MGDKLKLLVPEKKDAFSRIKRFMTKADITLNADEEVILSRWLYCDVLLRQGVKGHDEIVAVLCEEYRISKFTAINDINQAQRIGEVTRSYSKKYWMHFHLERINQDISKLREKMYKGDRLPTDDELQTLAKLYDTYTKAMMAMPEEQTADKLPPPQFIFNIAPGQSLGDLPSAEAAMKEADEMIDLQENGDGVYEVEK